jgi:gliding motility-associated lipoprotein GldD
MKMNKQMIHPFQKMLAVLLIAFSILFYSCGSDDDEVISPKPRAYFRLTFPKKEYVHYDNGECPFSFEIPAYSKMHTDNESHAEPCWLNLDFPSFNGRLHLSYKPVNGNIDGYLEQTYTMAAKHQIKASGIEEQLVSKASSHVYGLIYNIEGNAASSIQFFLTDSVQHFIRGAFYFNAVPNTDSTKPVVAFIEKDIQHLIETFQWKNFKLILPPPQKSLKSASTADHK